MVRLRWLLLSKLGKKETEWKRNISSTTKACDIVCSNISSWIAMWHLLNCCSLVQQKNFRHLSSKVCELMKLTCHRLIVLMSCVSASEAEVTSQARTNQEKQASKEKNIFWQQLHKQTTLVCVISVVTSWTVGYSVNTRCVCTNENEINPSNSKELSVYSWLTGTVKRVQNQSNRQCWQSIAKKFVWKILQFCYAAVKWQIVNYTLCLHVSLVKLAINQRWCVPYAPTHVVFDMSTDRG